MSSPGTQGLRDAPVVTVRARDAARAVDAAGAPDALARVVLLVFAFLLPFEAPLVHVGPLVLTTVELLLYATVAAWGLGIAARAVGDVVPGARGDRAPRGSRLGRLREAVAARLRAPLPRAAAIWLAVVGLSALAAPSHRAPALKFFLRASSGGLLFFAVRDLVRTPAQARRIALALVAGAGVAAVGALIETHWPEAAAWWAPFRPRTFSATGLDRASGPFAYPTIASMYWEALLPLALVAVPFAGRDAGVVRAGPSAHVLRDHVRGVLGIGVSGLLATAVLLSGTRTSLVGALLGTVGMLLYAVRTPGPVRTVATGTLVVVVALTVNPLVAGRTSPLGQRLMWWRDGTWYGARYTVDPRPLTVAPRELVEVPIALRNTGTLTWRHDGRKAVHLAYHWETSGAGPKRSDFEGRRTELPGDVAPGDSVALRAQVAPPDVPGAYRLRWDLVAEEVAWFSEHGTPTTDQAVTVVATARPRNRSAPVPSTRPSVFVGQSLEEWLHADVPSRPILWRAAVALFRAHPLLGVGPDNFRHVYGDVLPRGTAPAAGGPRTVADERIHANSLYFETLADLGVAGILALGLLMVAVARALGASAGVRDRPLRFAFGLATGVFFVHGLLDYFLEFTPTFGLWWLLLALTAGSWSAMDRPAAPASSKP